MNQVKHMTARKYMTRLMLASVLATGAGLAQASTFDLNLTGVVSEGQSSSFTIGDTHYDRWLLSLSGLDANNAITVVNGDTINTTITFDHSFTIPASVQLTSFLLSISGTTFPAVDTGTTGSMAFSLHDVPVASASNVPTTSSSQLPASLTFFPPENVAMTLDKVTSSFTITALGQPATLDRALVVYTLFSPAVPEPQTYAMALSGLIIVGALARRQSKELS
jgi:hypothetical protein